MENHYKKLFLETMSYLDKIPNWIKRIYGIPTTPKWIQELKDFLNKEKQLKKKSNG